MDGNCRFARRVHRPMQAFWLEVARLGDLRLIAPAFLLVCALLWCFGKRREMLTMAASFVAALILIGTLKYTVNPFDASIFSFQLHAQHLPSGHVGMSIVFLPGDSHAVGSSASGMGQGPRGTVGESRRTREYFGLAAWWHSRLETTAGVLVGAVVILFTERVRSRCRWLKGRCCGSVPRGIDGEYAVARALVVQQPGEMEIGRRPHADFLSRRHQKAKNQPPTLVNYCGSR